MLGFEQVGQGATSKIYRDGDRAIKFYESIRYEDVLREASNQKAAFEAGLPVPAVIDVCKLEGNAVALDMEYIDGQPLLQLKMDKFERKAAIETLVKLQCRVHKAEANNLPKQSERFMQRISQSPYLNDTDKKHLSDLLDSLDTSQNCLCHGDFHPLNILYDGSKHWIIDWVDATTGSPLADACRTYLIFKQFITRMAGIYLKAFCKEAKVKQDDVLAWLPIVAAGRMSENLDEKTRAWLMEFIK